MESCKTHTSRNDKNIVKIHARETTGLTYPHLLAKWKGKRNEQGMLAQNSQVFLQSIFSFR